jgi:hypothetical protein
MYLRLAFVCCLGCAILAGLWFHRRAPSRSTLDQLSLSLAPALACFLALLVAGAWAQGSLFYWNPPRFAPTFALARGYGLYSPLDSGPVLNTIYGPFSSILYLPIVLASTTHQVTATGAVLSGLYFFVPSIIYIWAARQRVPGQRLAAFYGIAYFVGMAIGSSSLQGSAFFQPVDAVAFGATTLSAAALHAHLRNPHGRSRWLLPASAFCAVLAICSKQTTAPLLFALPVYMAVVGTRRDALRFIVLLAAWGIAFAASIGRSYGRSTVSS